MLRRLFLGACVGVLGIGAPIPASAGTVPIVLSDPQGDTTTAMDVTTVSVSNDFHGTISFQITIKNPQGKVDPGDLLAVVMDTDQNSATGDVSRHGAEFSINFDGDGGAGGTPFSELLRWTGSGWTPAATPNSMQSTFTTLDASTLSLLISVNASDLANTVGLSFYINAVWPDPSPTNVELAPDSGTWEYKDVGTPTAAALRSAPVGTRHNELKFSINDDSGGASTKIRIFRIGTGTLTAMISFDPLAEGPWTTEWLVPRRIKGYQRFCVQAIDSFGNASGRRTNCRHVIFRSLKQRVVRTNIRRRDSGTGQHWDRVWLENLPRGTLVTIDCVSICNLHEGPVRDSGTFVSRKFSDRRLPDRAIIIVRATKARWAGFYDKITIGSGTNVEQVKRCMAPRLRTPSPRRVCS